MWGEVIIILLYTIVSMYMTRVQMYGHPKCISRFLFMVVLFFRLMVWATSYPAIPRVDIPPVSTCTILGQILGRQSIIFPGLPGRIL